MARFPFLGFSSRLYPQYIDNEADSTLVALPGQSYDMRPAGSRNLPVPPQDGLWGKPPAAIVPAALPAPPPAPPPAVVTPAASTEDEGNN